MGDSEKPVESFDQLGRLISLLCEGELSAEESAQLQQLLKRSAQARRYFLEYMQLHAELHWAAGMGREEKPAAPVLGPECPLGVPLPTPAGVRIRKAIWQWRWVLAAVGLLAVISLGIVLVGAIWKPGPGGLPPSPAPLARWGQTSLPQWAPGSAKPDSTPELSQGQTIELQSGYAEILFSQHTRVILEGPARFHLLGPHTAEVRFGRLSVYAPPEEPKLSLQTPWVVLEGANTQFGLLVEQTGAAEIHLFSGQVELRAREEGFGFVLRSEGKPDRPDQAPGQPQQGVLLEAGQAVRIFPPPEKATKQIEWVEIFPDLPGFVYRLPGEAWAARIAQFRAAVANHPALIHHYPFEGASAEERRQDRRGGLHLVEVVMSGGRGETQARFILAPAGADQWAFHPARGLYAGNRIGAALQTEALFQPPQNLTIEVLVNFAGFPPQQKTPIACLLATRADARWASFFLAVGGEGQLLHLMDADQPWQEAEGTLTPGEWYYLASTFQADPKKQTTLVNTYLANLTRGENTLQWVVKNQKLVGIPVSSPLGIGKGFDEQGRHAYPWPGLIDEIAIYSAVLDRQTFREHLNLLLGKSETDRGSHPK